MPNITSEEKIWRLEQKIDALKLELEAHKSTRKEKVENIPHHLREGAEQDYELELNRIENEIYWAKKDIEEEELSAAATAAAPAAGGRRKRKTRRNKTRRSKTRRSKTRRSK